MAESLPTKTLPHSLEAERAVLAGMMHDKIALRTGLELLLPIDERVKREASDQAREPKRNQQPVVTLFFHAPYQVLFDLLVDMEHRGQMPDFPTLLEEARSKKVLDQVGGAAAISELLSSAATGTKVPEYADILKEKYLKRRLILLSNRLTEQAYEDSEEAEVLLETAERDLHSLSDAGQRSSFRKISEFLVEIHEAMIKAHEKKGTITGVATHFTLLDEMTSGLQPTDLIILAARPSMGKTALALNIAANVASKGGQPIGIFSLEMSRQQVVQRMLSSHAKVDLKRLRSGFMSTREINSATNALGQMARLPIYVDDTPGLSISAVRARALRLKHVEPDLALLVIDYLQLMEGSSGRSGSRSRQEEVASISRGLKALARELEVPVLALSQLSRGVEGRESGMPRLSDLRESGAIEQDADVVLFIHRKKSYSDEEEDLTDIDAEIIIGKQRNGPIGTVTVAFISKYASFNNATRRDDVEAPPEIGGYDSEELSDDVYLG